MGLLEQLGIGKLVILSNDIDDILGLENLGEVRGKGNTLYKAEMNLKGNARKMRAKIVYDPKMSSRPGFDRNHDGFTFIGNAYGPEED